MSDARQLLVKIVVDSANAEKSFKNTADKVDTLKKSTDKASDKIDKLKKSSDNASDKVNDLKKSSDNASDKVTELGVAAKTAGDNAEKASGQVKKLATSTDNASGRFGSLKGSVDNLTQPFKDMSQSLEGVNKLLGLAGISVGLGTVAGILKDAADYSKTMRENLEKSDTLLSTLTANVDIANLRTIRDSLIKSDLGITAEDAGNIIGQVSKYFGGTDAEIENISRKILTLQKMGIDVDVKNLSENLEAAGISISDVAGSIDLIYSATKDTKLTFSDFVDDAERLANIDFTQTVTSIEDFYRTVRGDKRQSEDKSTQRGNIDASIPDSAVRLFGLGSGASVGRIITQAGEDYQSFSDKRYAETGNDLISQVSAAVDMVGFKLQTSIPGLLETVLIEQTLKDINESCTRYIINPLSEGLKQIFPNNLETGNTFNYEITQVFTSPNVDSYVVRNATENVLNSRQSRSMKL